jgi:hypothetical protein
MFDARQDAVGVALGVNYTSKTQYLFRINKWTREEWDSVAINRPQSRDERPVPFDRIAYFGDGFTDVPTMRLVTDQGGYAVAVYNEGDPLSEAAALELRHGDGPTSPGPGTTRKAHPSTASPLPCSPR